MSTPMYVNDRTGEEFCWTCGSVEEDERNEANPERADVPDEFNYHEMDASEEPFNCVSCGRLVEPEAED